MLSSLRNLLDSYTFPRDVREEATLGLFTLLLVMSAAALAMQARVAALRPTAYTLECSGATPGVRNTFYGCPSVSVNSDHAWCGDVRVQGVCSARKQH